MDGTGTAAYTTVSGALRHDIVNHSLTRFLSGHGTSMGGIVVESGRFDWEGSGRFPFLTDPDPIVDLDRALTAAVDRSAATPRR